jgi:hypothetical protein
VFVESAILGREEGLDDTLGTTLMGTKIRRSRAYSAISVPSFAWIRVITGGSYFASLS